MSVNERLPLTWLPGRYAVCRLDPLSSVPDWASGPGFVSVSATTDELSVIVDQERIPPGTQAERDWMAFRVVGQLEFGLVGILARLSGALADAGISIMAVSTYDTDVVLVKADERERAQTALEAVGEFG